ncbi:hypothetical protein [Sphingomonas hankookensis]|uniref:hypothetical protein n=1 Tax=Sphingomonas hankookensis TaxID=563996 RepID=UPI003F7A6F0D
MRTVLALALIAMPAAAMAQATPPATPTPAPVAALGPDTPIEAIIASPKGKAVMEKEMPTLLTHPMFDSFKAMSLRQLQPYSGGAITDEKLAAVTAALNAAK